MLFVAIVNGPLYLVILCLYVGHFLTDISKYNLHNVQLTHCTIQ